MENEKDVEVPDFCKGSMEAILADLVELADRVETLENAMKNMRG
jgi:hypothetical protein